MQLLTVGPLCATDLLTNLVRTEDLTVSGKSYEPVFYYVLMWPRERGSRWSARLRLPIAV
jgi:hypothetical protein